MILWFERVRASVAKEEIRCNGHLTLSVACVGIRTASATPLPTHQLSGPLNSRWIPARAATPSGSTGRRQRERPRTTAVLAR